MSGAIPLCAGATTGKAEIEVARRDPVQHAADAPLEVFDECIVRGRGGRGV